MVLYIMHSNVHHRNMHRLPLSARPNSLIAAYGQIVPWNIPGQEKAEKAENLQTTLGFRVEIMVFFMVVDGYGSIPINTIFRGMNIHLPAILGFTMYQGFDPSPDNISERPPIEFWKKSMCLLSTETHA